MKKENALKALNIAPRSDSKKSKINPHLTQAQAVDIVERAINDPTCYDQWGSLPEIFKKRIYQVCCDKKRPSQEDVIDIKGYIYE